MDECKKGANRDGPGFFVSVCRKEACESNVTA